MRDVASSRAHLAEAIATALKDEQLESAVRDATGKELFVVFASPRDPPAKAVQQALESLDRTGHGRWLLTYCLTSTMTDERLRKMIFRNCPETLQKLPPIGTLVDKVQEGLLPLLRLALQPQLVDDFRDSRIDLVDIARHLATMSALKALHECLHGLQAKLALGARLTVPAGVIEPPAVASMVADIQAACKTAHDIVAALPTGSVARQTESAWIDELEAAARQLAPGEVMPDGMVAPVDAEAAERIVRMQMSRLNQQIFVTARLPLHPLFQSLPDELQDDEEGVFEAHESAVLDLAPTVLARALKHKLWQDVENEFTPILAFLDIPSSDPSQFYDQWLRLKARIAWLAALDPDAEWARETQVHCDDIDDQWTDIVDKHVDAQAAAGLKDKLEAFHAMVLLTFLAVDAGLKSDCASLCEIGASLSSIVAELGHA